MDQKELSSAILKRINTIYPETNNTSILIRQIATIAANVFVIAFEEYEKMSQ